MRQWQHHWREDCVQQTHRELGVQHCLCLCPRSPPQAAQLSPNGCATGSRRKTCCLVSQPLSQWGRWGCCWWRRRLRQARRQRCLHFLDPPNLNQNGRKIARWLFQGLAMESLQMIVTSWSVTGWKPASCQTRIHLFGCAGRHDTSQNYVLLQGAIFVCLWHLC